MQVSMWVYIGAQVINVILTAIIGGIAWMFRQLLQAQKDKIISVESRVATIEQERALLADLVRIERQVDATVSKEEWLRDSTANRQRLEKIITKVDELNGRSIATVEIATVVAATMNQMRKDSDGR